MFMAALFIEARIENNPNGHQFMNGKQKVVYPYNEILFSY